MDIGCIGHDSVSSVIGHGLACRADPGGDSTQPDTGVRCMLLRGGTSKGAYFLAEDLPADPGERYELLLRIMGRPDPRQIHGNGGAHPTGTLETMVDLVAGELFPHSPRACLLRTARKLFDGTVFPRPQ